MTTSLLSRTSWLEEATETCGKRVASSEAILWLRGDSRIAGWSAEAELNPVTIALVIAPVPTKPSFISPSQQPHHPARHKNSAHEHGKAIQAVANLLAGGRALGDAKNHRSKHTE